ncbi:MAG: tetratricopeptide repeat protein [Azonexus sp.]|nr:tetratricopeptide repeat protein [Azonexus sp.]
MKSIAAFTLAFASTVAIADDAARIFEQVSPSVVTVQTLDETGSADGHGSGVVIAPTRVVTNCHVVREARTLQVRRADKELPARWLSADLPRDLCVLEVPGLEAPPVKQRASDLLTTGERVFAVGNPLGFGLAVSAGLVSTIAPAEGERRIYTSASLSPGSSGGGLFDSEGRLVGITTAVMSLGQNLNIAMPAEWVAEIASRGTTPPVIPEVPPPEPRWQIDADAFMIKRDWKALAELAQRWSEAQPKSPTAWQRMGLAQQNMGQLADAEKSQRASLALHEKNAEARVELGSTLDLLGRKKEAEQAFRQAMVIYPGSGYPHLQLAKVRHVEKRYDEAKKGAQIAVLQSASNAFSWWLLGDIEEKLGNPEAASLAFRVAQRHLPNEPELTASLARTLAAAGKGEQAREIIAKSPGAGKMSATDWIRLGLAEGERKRHTDAENAFRKALEVDPRSAVAWTSLAYLQYSSGRREAAEASIDQALAIDAKHVPSLSQRAERRAMDKDYPAARALLERIVVLEPQRVASWRLLGAVQFETHDYAGAVESYRRATALPDALVEDWVGLGNSCLKTGKLAEAESALKTAERQAPDNNGVLMGLSWLYGNRGDNQRALAYYERLLTADGSSVQGWSGKGHALMRLNRHDEAVQALETAVRLQPDFANAWINLGQALLMQKQLGKAINVLERATRLAPQAADARLYLAQAYLASGQTSPARASLNKLMTLQPNAPPVLSLATLLNLAEGKNQDAKASFLLLWTVNPIAARAFRNEAVAKGIPGAATLPE